MLFSDFQKNESYEGANKMRLAKQITRQIALAMTLSIASLATAESKVSLGIDQLVHPQGR